MTAPLKIGVVGLGFGAAVHAPALLARKDVELVGIAGRSLERTQIAANKLGVKAYSSIDELLGSGLDAITLALPPDQVEIAVRKALEANVAVLCEKPLGTAATVAAELAALAKNQITAVDFIFGELETFGRLKRLIDSKMYGEVRKVKVEWFTESLAYRNKKWSWKTDAEQGGGVISLFGSHLFYLEEWLLGTANKIEARINKPLAEEFAPAGAKAAEDHVYYTMHHGNIVLEAEVSNSTPGTGLHRWTVEFEHGTATLENIGSDYIAGFKLTTPNETLLEPKVSGDGRLTAFGTLADRFAEAVREQKPMFPNFANGARVQAIDAALRLSAASAKIVHL